MGAWGEDTFDNDTAGDWGDDLEDADDGLEFVQSTLSSVVDTPEGEPVGALAAMEALAACEVIARLQHRPGKQDAYTETVDAWVASHPQAVPPALTQQCLAAITRVLAENSELRDLGGAMVR